MITRVHGLSCEKKHDATSRVPNRHIATEREALALLPQAIPQALETRDTRSMPEQAPMNSERHIVFIDELRRRSDIEACIGAAEYAAEQPGWTFNPWPIGFGQNAATAKGLCVATGILANERSLARAAAPLRRSRVPIVYYLANATHAREDSVAVDEPAIGQLAAEHLWNRGYRHFAFVGSSAFGWSKARAQGFSQWLSDAGKSSVNCLFDAKKLPVFWSWNLTQRNQHIQELLARLPRPCGIMAANDVVACFVLQAARHHGMRVPDDFGVVGVDNDPLPNAAAGLAISSIDLPFREVGRQAARLLHERWHGRQAGSTVKLPPIRVVVRSSTNIFMSPASLVRKAQAFIESHRHQRVTVAQLAAEVGSNRVTLGKYFHREFDTTLLEYICRRRLAYATELLRLGEDTVDEVAWKCGFSSTSYFSKIFKRFTNQRPGAARNFRST
jgi:LacI family transcriptional regulator